MPEPIKNYIDLTHTLEDGTLGFSLKKGDETIRYTMSVRTFLTHEESLPYFNNQCSFEISELRFQTSIGTYLDSPSHRYAGMRDISELRLEELILPGIVINISGAKPQEPVGLECLPEGIDLAGKAVLFCFGWDQYWNQPGYFNYPYLDRAVIERLIQEKVKLVGVDTPNIDHAKDLTRPAHSWLLARDIFIVENLMGLRQLMGQGAFDFFALPIKVKRVVAMPVRAFAILTNK